MYIRHHKFDFGVENSYKEIRIMPLIVHRTHHTLHSLLYSNYVCNLYKVYRGCSNILKKISLFWTFGTNVPGGVGNEVKTKVERRVHISYH